MEYLVGIAWVAEQLGLTERAVNKMIERGDLPPPFQCGRKRYWRVETITRHFTELERRAARPPRKDGPSATAGQS